MLRLHADHQKMQQKLQNLKRNSTWWSESKYRAESGQIRKRTRESTVGEAAKRGAIIIVQGTEDVELDLLDIYEIQIIHVCFAIV